MLFIKYFIIILLFGKIPSQDGTRTRQKGCFLEGKTGVFRGIFTIL
jgi:hypothetical protein